MELKNFFGKNIDDKFMEIGFEKVSENLFCTVYERNDEKYRYVQCIELVIKSSGFHIMHSYQKDINSDGFNNSVGLTMYEAKLCRVKMKQMGMREKKGNRMK